jgi:predicted acyl esterase
MQLPLSPPEPVLTNLSYPQLHESGLAKIRVETVAIPMRDDIRLSADLYRDPAVAFFTCNSVSDS